MPTDSTTFVAQTTVITAAWLNSVNAAVFADAVNVKRFGAVGDGVTDSTAALTAAEAAAFAAGVALYVPQGTYLFDGQWNIRVNLYSDGATIKQAHASVNPVNAAGVINLNANGLFVREINVDGALKSTGFSGAGITDAVLLSCKASNCVNLGFCFVSCANILIDSCRATTIHYYVVPSTGAPADGFYFGGCTNSTWVDCYAADFRRIGFVSEGDGATKSDKITGLRCVASNANNCDDSTTEYNAAFWAENTNNVDWIACVGYNLAGNPGQTSGRTRGMTGYAGGGNAVGTANIIGCRLFGGAGNMVAGITAEGNPAFLSTVNIVDCFVSGANAGISSLCSINRLTIERVTLDAITAPAAGHGGVVIDGTGPSILNDLVISEITSSNSTYGVDSAVVVVYAAPSGCNYQLRDCQAITHIMHGPVVKLTVENCAIQCGSTTYASFLASLTRLMNCDLSLRSGVVLVTAITALAAVPVGSTFQINGGSISNGTLWEGEFEGTDTVLMIEDVQCTNFTFSISSKGNPIETFQGCIFVGIDPVKGAIRANFNLPTKEIFVVQNCYFQDPTLANTPIRKWTNDPTKSVLQGNVYNTTNLTNFGVVTSNVNNVAV